jgi:hypothetical protein
MDIDRRIVQLIRKSDNKKLPAEVRIMPTRFSEDMTTEWITISFMNFGEKNSFTVLQYDDDWNWSNDEYECYFVLPEATVRVEPKTQRSVSPISQKRHNMTVTE